MIDYDKIRWRQIELAVPHIQGTLSFITGHLSHNEALANQRD